MHRKNTVLPFTSAQTAQEYLLTWKGNRNPSKQEAQGVILNNITQMLNPSFSHSNLN